MLARQDLTRKDEKITVIPFTSQQQSSVGAARVFVPKSSLNGLSKNSELIVIDPATFDKKRFIE